MRGPSTILLALLLATQAGRADWRIDLLEARGIGTTGPALRKAASGTDFDTDALEAAYHQLGSERYPEREEAQKKILAMGPEALVWLREQPVSPHPEIRHRLAEIRSALEFSSGDRLERMVVHAARSLLDEIGKPADPATGGVFHEWFGLDAGPLGESYRRFQCVAPEGMKGRVENGSVVFEGKRPGDDDQRLMLHAPDWPGGDEFPADFTVSTRLGGTPGGSGAWHLGVSIGRVRALYHPGYPGGGFRFEQVGTADDLTRNASMGFTPSTDEPQWMTVQVHRLENGSVHLTVSVRQQGSAPFKTTIKAAAEMIGPIDRISLDRSGRVGGDARFSELTIELGGP